MSDSEPTPSLNQKIDMLREKFEMVRHYDPVWDEDTITDFDIALKALIKSESDRVLGEFVEGLKDEALYLDEDSELRWINTFRIDQALIERNKQ